ncbi:MAG: hypothetical protein ACLFPX_08365, partial [Candidatus Omnitrophota bacterium]
GAGMNRIYLLVIAGLGAAVLAGCSATTMVATSCEGITDCQTDRYTKYFYGAEFGPERALKAEITADIEKKIIPGAYQVKSFFDGVPEEQVVADGRLELSLTNVSDQPLDIKIYGIRVQELYHTNEYPQSREALLVPGQAADIVLSGIPLEMYSQGFAVQVEAAADGKEFYIAVPVKRLTAADYKAYKARGMSF